MGKRVCGDPGADGPGIEVGSDIARHLRRFYVESLPEAGKLLTLRGDEAHHMVNVVRVRPGEEVVLFDGSGREARARLSRAARSAAEIEVLSHTVADREPGRRLTLACALPRATRMDFLVEKCCELGLARLIPMVTRRSVVDPLGRQENHLRRWKRITIEAAKQSGRTRLTEVTAVLPYESAALAKEPGAARIILSPEPEAIELRRFAETLSEGQPVFALIGPEGGFAPEELDFARRHGCMAVTLGRRILRVETAAVALTAFLLVGEA